MYSIKQGQIVLFQVVKELVLKALTAVQMMRETNIKVKGIFIIRIIIKYLTNKSQFNFMKERNNSMYWNQQQSCYFNFFGRSGQIILYSIQRREMFEPIDRNKAQILQKIYQNLQAPSHSPVSRIFQPPSFLFKHRDEQASHNLPSKTKISHGTIHGFRPKFQNKDKRQHSGGKRFRVKQNYQRANRAKKILEENLHLEKKLDQLIDKQVNNFRESHRIFINPNKKQLKKEIMNTEHVNKSLDAKNKETQSEISPYAKYSVNAFPKKQLRTLITKQKSLYPGRDDLAIKLKSTLKQKMEQIQGKMYEDNNSDTNKMLQIMTIYSIKEKPLPANSFFKKKQQQRIYELREKSQPHNEGRSQQKDANEVDLIKQNISRQKIYQKRIYSYMAFLSKVNYSNNIPIRNFQLSEKVNNSKIQVFVGNGNNRYLIIALLKRRFWLEVTNKITVDTKFIWTQNSMKEIHSSQKSYNKYLISQAQKETKQQKSKNKIDNSKMKIKINTMTKMNPQESIIVMQKPSSYQSANLIQPQCTSQESLTPLNPTIKVKIKNKAARQLNKKLFVNPQKSQQAQFYLKSFKIKIKKQVQALNLQKISTITNHVPHNSFIGSKKALFYTMEHYYRNIKKIDPFTIIPKTYHFKSPNDDSYATFLQNQKQLSQKSIWIVKPGQCTNRGAGISIIRAAQVTRKLLKKQFHQNGQAKTTIIQSYITDPLLYNGRKFDIRHYMMISIVNGNLKAYWYSQGYIRTSSQFFTLQDLNNPYIHLTNDAIQKYSEKYGKYEPGNKLSYHELQRYFDHHYQKPSINFRADILTQMKEIATDVIKANYKRLDKQRKMNNFELFGLDFMIDRKFKPWLIEINSNPCLQISCPLHSRIIPLLLEHTLRLGLDPLILPTSHYPPNQRYYLSDNFMQNLRYQIIFDQLQYHQEQPNAMPLQYNFDFDQPQDEYQNQGTEIDLGKLLD